MLNETQTVRHSSHNEKKIDIYCLQLFSSQPHLAGNLFRGTNVALNFAEMNHD